MYWYKLNIGDWSLSTVHLSLIEEAIYFRLVNHYYDSESLIPLETDSVIRRLRLGSHAEIVKQILEEFFEYTPKGWMHPRCEIELKEYRRQAKKNKENGMKGGRPNKQRASSVSHSQPTGNPLGSQVVSQNNPNQELRTKNQEPPTKNQEPDKGGRFTPPSIDALIFEFTGKVLMPEVEAKKFLGYYGSNDWKVGKNKMKSWKHAVAGWAARMPPVEQVLGFEHKHMSTDWADDIINQQLEHQR